MTHGPSGRPDDDDSVPRDAWLVDALRHAPDAEVEAPAAVREEILRRARAASATSLRREPAPSRRPAAWRAVWDAMARPMVAGGLGTAAVAVMVAVLWWQGAPPTERMAMPPMPEAASPAVTPAPPVRQAAPQVTAPTRDATVPPEAHKAREPEKAREARTARGAEQTRKAPAAPTKAAPMGSPGAAVDTTSPGRAAPAPATSSTESAPAGAPVMPQTMAAPLDPLHAAAASLQHPVAPLHWTHSGRDLAHGAAQHAWFDAARRAAAGRWQHDETVAPTEGTHVQLFEGERLVLDLVLTPRGLVLSEPAGVRWRAALDAASAAELERLLQRW